MRLAERFGQLPQVVEEHCDASVLRMLALEALAREGEEVDGVRG